MKPLKSVRIVVAVALLLGSAVIAESAAIDTQLGALQSDFAKTRHMEKAQRLSALQRVVARAHELAVAFPNQQEPLIWEAVTMADYAGAKRDLAGLRMLKDAQRKLQDAERAAHGSFDWSAADFMADLYAHTPGWPIAFGDQKLARSYFEKAVAAAPDLPEPRIYYGRFLFEKGEYSDAARYLSGALDLSRRARSESSVAAGPCNAMMCPRDEQTMSQLLDSARDLLAQALRKAS